MNEQATKYRDTGGMQACALAGGGKVRIVREDVGRHNAVDKVLGRAWLDRIPTDDAVLLSTGRVSYEMAVKAAKARVPVVASKSAVTDLAAEIAASLGICVVGYLRGGAMVVYTHPERVRGRRGVRIMLTVEQARIRPRRASRVSSPSRYRFSNRWGVCSRQTSCPTSTSPRSTTPAMDGYAVRAADTSGATDDAPVVLRVVDHIAAGHAVPMSAPARRLAS